MSLEPPIASTSVLAILDSIDSPVIALERNGAVQLVNDAAEQWLGRSRQRLLGTPITTCEPWGQRLLALAERALQVEMAVHEELSFESASMSIAACPWWDADNLRGAVLIAQLPRSVAPGQERSDVSALAAGLAHEVRNPLAALRGAAELLSADLPGGSDASLREYVDLILRETARVDALVARLLVVARPLPLERTSFRCDELLHDLARQAEVLARARGVAVVVAEEYDPTLPALQADRERLFEAFVNLLKNSVEALPPSGGRITLSASVDPKRQRTASGSRGLLAFSITDNGPGLGTVRDRLFTPFFTTKASGTGLGLLMARRAIEAHGGVLTLRDRLPPESGAEALVLLPIEANHG